MNEAISHTLILSALIILIIWTRMADIREASLKEFSLIAFLGSTISLIVLFIPAKENLLNTILNYLLFVLIPVGYTLSVIFFLSSGDSTE